MNFIDPVHLHGVMNGFPSSSVSSRQILHALPLSEYPLPTLPFNPPPSTFSLGFPPLKYDVRSALLQE